MNWEFEFARGKNIVVFAVVNNYSCSHLRRSWWGCGTTSVTSDEFQSFLRTVRFGLFFAVSRSFAFYHTSNFDLTSKYMRIYQSHGQFIQVVEDHRLSTLSSCFHQQTYGILRSVFRRRNDFVYFTQDDVLHVASSSGSTSLRYKMFLRFECLWAL